MHRFALMILVLAVTASCESKKLGVAGATCTASADCSGELQCIASICVDSSAAAGVTQVMGAGKQSMEAFEALAESKKKAAASEVLQLQAACEQYLLQKSNECPKSVTDLKAAGVIARVRRDPWGAEYVITCPGQHGAVDVTSYGPDQAPDGGDDISSSVKAM